MKTKTLLALATVATISVATVGSYAAWDIVSDTATGTTTTIDRVNVAANAMVAPTITHVLEKAPVINGTASFDLSSVATGLQTGRIFELVVEVTDGTTALLPADYTATLKKGETEIAGGKDLAPGFTAKEEYTVEISLNDSAADTVDGKNLTISVTGTLK